MIDIKDFLTINETIIYDCEVKFNPQDAGYEFQFEKPYKLQIYLTNYRLIWVKKDRVCSSFLKQIEACTYLEGYGEFETGNGWGTGNYAISCNGVRFWFYSEEVCKTLYNEIIRLTTEYLYE